MRNLNFLETRAVCGIICVKVILPDLPLCLLANGAVGLEVTVLDHELSGVRVQDQLRQCDAVILRHVKEWCLPRCRDPRRGSGHSCCRGPSSRGHRRSIIEKHGAVHTVCCTGVLPRLGIRDHSLKNLLDNIGILVNLNHVLYNNYLCLLCSSRRT